jgi:hypothetical protein
MEQQFKTEEILKSTEFTEFYKTAIDFCDFIENFSSNHNVEFLAETRIHLLKLYYNALKLQWVDLQSNIEYDDKLDSDKFDKTLLLISERLGDARYYWHVFDPMNNIDKEAVCGDLVDDLGDIYQDLKFSILTFNLNKEDCQENALWQFKFDFDKHWGDHCINALNAIHFCLQNE